MSKNSKLIDKNILFFSIQTFGLEIEIKNKLEQLGAHVTFFDERPANNNFVKGIIRLKPSLMRTFINSYYRKILKEISKIDFDFLFLNRGEVVPEFFLKELKLAQPSCTFIFYTWDSFNNLSHPISILKYFDRKFTFDSNDAVKFNLNFRPLFFLDQFKSIKSNVVDNKKYDILFLGTAHSDRYRLSNQIISWCNNNGFTSFLFYFIHSRFVFFYKKLFDKSFQDFEYRKMSFKSLTIHRILELYSLSDVILDINHPGQSGLTMRTFESIGSGKKLITTNFEVKKYCFFHPNNIFVIDRNNVEIDKNFFGSKYLDIDPIIYEKLSIEGWINSLFFDFESNIWLTSKR
jgi:hypothetical protein